VHQRLRSARALLASISLPPTTYNEKVRYRIATDRRRILATFADRVAARDYVRERVGESILTRVYAITSSPETLSRADLPREFVLKVSHGSGGMIIVAGHAPRVQRLPRPPVGWQRLHVHPDSLDWENLIDLSRHWLSLRYEPSEWAYSKARPRVIIEEHLASDGTTPPDYKFLVFDGRVRVIWVDQDRFGDHRRNFYSPAWESLDVGMNYPCGNLVPRPAKLDAMIAVAERLADRIDFVRVDLYNIDDRIIFGELTNYPEGGWARFDPPEFDAELGSLWSLADGRRRRLLTRRR
jgi:hypothetical protein